ncbi:hypothetical protein C8R44DRAFT_894346 [Mycena epipterygia]|nr:hypothetical protein C8R44DRAFT_894346 [Mycena epipterygia]
MVWSTYYINPHCVTPQPHSLPFFPPPSPNVSSRPLEYAICHTFVSNLVLTHSQLVAYGGLDLICPPISASQAPVRPTPKLQKSYESKTPHCLTLWACLWGMGWSGTHDRLSLPPLADAPPTMIPSAASTSHSTDNNSRVFSSRPSFESPSPTQTPEASAYDADGHGHQATSVEQPQDGLWTPSFARSSSPSRPRTQEPPNDSQTNKKQVHPRLAARAPHALALRARPLHAITRPRRYRTLALLPRHHLHSRLCPASSPIFGYLPSPRNPLAFSPPRHITTRTRTLARAPDLAPSSAILVPPSFRALSPSPTSDALAPSPPIPPLSSHHLASPCARARGNVALVPAPSARADSRPFCHVTTHSPPRARGHDNGVLLALAHANSCPRRLAPPAPRARADSYLCRLALTPTPAPAPVLAPEVAATAFCSSSREPPSARADSSVTSPPALAPAPVRAPALAPEVVAPAFCWPSCAPLSARADSSVTSPAALAPAPVLAPEVAAPAFYWPPCLHRLVLAHADSRPLVTSPPALARTHTRPRV